MSAIERLLSNYSRQVRLPWAPNLSGKQRVWFVVYPPAEERRIRARLPQFEQLTNQAGHGWTAIDLTRTLPEFLAAHKYRESIFQNPPSYFRPGSEIETRAAAMVKGACSRDETDANGVVAVTGLASLFDFVRISSLIDRTEDSVHGRLVVFFPGEYANNTFRFMEAREGFNYLAVPITSTESFTKA